MCTIGGMIKNGGIILFKNCDLVKKAKFFKPRLLGGKYRYIGFTRKNRPGIWAGMNELGLGIVAADAHMKKKYKARPHMVNNIFKAYESTVANCADTSEALNFLKIFYEKGTSVPDLVIVGDRKNMCVIEFAPPRRWKIKCVKSSFIVRSNHFLILKGSPPRKEDTSSYQRYETARKAMMKNHSVKGVMKLCRNHDNGPSENSICRHGGNYKYRTQASVVMAAGSRGITAYYIINNFPCKKKYEIARLGM